ncbi:MAG TPA: RDD family protein [Pseudonocardiaceae bacterium]|nr:RDD family protein [Pseudonocardiaceae bacterium]
MTGRFEAWLAGGSAAAKPQVSTVDPDGGAQAGVRYPGQRYDLPASGAGSVAAMGRRLAALLVDCVLAALITSLFVHVQFARPETMQTLNYWSVLTWFVLTVAGTSFFGVTPGMLLLRLRLARVDGHPTLPPWRAAARALLVALIVPAVIWDGDHRGLHDKAAGTIVLVS